MLSEEKLKAERERMGQALQAAMLRKAEAEQAVMNEARQVEQLRGVIAGINLALGVGGSPDEVNGLAWFSSLTLDKVAQKIRRRKFSEAAQEQARAAKKAA